MTDRTWTGVVSNDASDPANWSPSDSAPLPGDSLTVPAGSTMDITDNVLQGDTLTLGVSGPPTFLPMTTTLNLSHNANVNLSATSILFEGAVEAVVNVEGNGTVNGSIGGEDGSVTVNLTHANLFGSWVTDVFDNVTISGDQHSKFHNDGVSATSGGQLILNTDVVGSGTFDVYGVTFRHDGFLEFGDSVSHGQTVQLYGASLRTPYQAVMQVDHPDEFHGTVDLHDFSLADFLGLAQADGWSYKNDLLTLKNACGDVIDRFHVAVDAPITSGGAEGLSLSKNAAGEVQVSPGTDFKGSL